MNEKDKPKLRLSMSLSQFDNGYWYTADLKAFAKEIGIPTISKLRKDQLEASIRHFLETGTIKNPIQKKMSTSGPKDVDLGLSLNLPISNYCDNRETKAFLKTWAEKRISDFKQKSGVMYRLNRWREEQLNNGHFLTYGDLLEKYIELNQTEGAFEKIPHGRYINFLSDFLKNEPNGAREEALKAWEELKDMDIPKEYEAWYKIKTNDLS